MKQGTEAYARRESLIAAARAYKAQGHSNKEVAERFSKSEAWAQTWCRGISSQEHNPEYLRNQYTSGKFDRIENARRIIAKHHPGFEYAGDFKDVDSPVTIRCKICGTERTASMVTLRHDGRITCSECQRRQKQKEEKAKARKEAAKAARSFNNKTQLSMRFCEACGEIIPGTQQRFCRACAQRIQNRRDNVKKDKRRVAAFTVDTHTITLAKLYARDKGVCWLCGQPCDFSAGINDNLYPSIDHVVPISKGGKDEWANIRLAHRICNSKRGNGGPA